jgi:DNA-binding NarL/FixJ family response regulator
MRGASNRALAAALSLSERTIEGHVSRILGKLDLTSRAQIAVWAVQQGLIGPDDAAPPA